MKPFINDESFKIIERTELNVPQTIFVVSSDLEAAEHTRDCV